MKNRYHHDISQPKIKYISLNRTFITPQHSSIEKGAPAELGTRGFIMKFYTGILRFGLSAFLVVGACSAHAASEILLTLDQTRIFPLTQAPATVVVGNPAVADVTLKGKSLFLYPHGFGQTNLILLDEEGKAIGDYMLRVAADDVYSMNRFSPGGRETFSCRRDCQPSSK
jgi:Flp pilus assembly secretin CpaC